MVSSYQFKLARSPAEVESYYALRHAIFVVEQKLFSTTDLDELDAIAYPIVAIAPDAATAGVVRIYELESGLWYGGRLGVHANHRRGWQVGKGLIQKAVTTAHGWGCRQFLATVQLQNVRFFQRLHWTSLEELTICDRQHHLMEADLTFYPPSAESRLALSSHPQAS